MNETTHAGQREKPEFGPRTLAVMVSKVNSQFPEELTTDWRQFVRSELKLSTDQDRALSDVSEDRVREIQGYFAQAARHVGRGGAVNAKIVTRPIEKRTERVVHEIHVQFESPDMTPQRSIVIAHCDANCRHWGWGRG